MLSARSASNLEQGYLTHLQRRKQEHLFLSAVHFLVDELAPRLLVQLVETRRVTGASVQIKIRVKLEPQLKCVPFSDSLLHDRQGRI